MINKARSFFAGVLQGLAAGPLVAFSVALLLLAVPVGACLVGICFVLDCVSDAKKKILEEK